MKIAIIVVNWNSGNYLLKCLRSIKNQTISPNKVIVVDNDSTDGSLKQAELEFHDVTFLKNNYNAGFAAANNLAVSECASCEWICLLNPDAFPKDDWLEKLTGAIEKHPEYDSFASLILDSNNTGIIDSAGDQYTNSGVALHRFHGIEIDNVRLVCCDVFAPAGAAALYRRDIFISVNGFDESYFCYYEDVDLGFRMHLSGCKCLLVSDAIVFHVSGGVTGGENNATSNYYCQRNFIATYIKNMPMPLFLYSLPVHLYTILKGVLKGILKGNGILILKATLYAFIAVPKYWKMRHTIQSQRKLALHDLLIGSV